ncbi:cellulase family glycosylhydrolase [Streptomyces stelliscabiei]|uniref:Endoglucanase n=2 Tax=Streptomyces stelliscabiei TaxID=146820 RepID=A0A8I0P2M7_9ACTN|nr:cellulase family glycosylhydrolase [Streptomyces stelliscabiei]KND46426.1 beta-mannosidase [Streptomyces stelliscabiei]MBE1595139.1 mannan endo-1,4-beta-mannosidase [Streptomyces stelliscabiei]MDX2516104.1 cellulase family glycosylhydrolase [Streptomyces stelliscabiei]MDX2553076.1 cellulase family glycosylhydrolase [Streptomyces stelliscabiei]MDX2612064.1 cellulase family glycosylhydrolase [Streptomyces stelliscabiei]
MRSRKRTTAPARVPRAATLAAALLGLLLPLFVLGTPAHAAPPGFRIENGRLLERSGNDFVMRGVNHAHTWYADRIGSLAHIKAKGANTVRVVLSSGDRWTRNDTADVANVVTQCKRNRLICVLEVHDTTGYGEQSGAVTLSRAADYWIGVRSALTGQEDHVIVNIGNEPYGNDNYAGWTADTKAAIQKLRAAGFGHTIMVDAPNWGQDWAFTMRDNAASVFAADPDANTIFSIHMYGVFDTAAEVNDYLNRFVAARLPIVVGEFGHDHSDGNPDEDAILATAQRLGLGYLGWSWSGNGGGVEYLDMVTGFDPNRLTSWGQRLFNGANGIAATSKEAAIYASSGGDTTPPTAPGTPTASVVTSSSATLTWSAATDASGVTGYDVVRVNGATETAATTTTGTSATLTGLAPATSHTFAVYARDAAGNRSARSGTVNVTTASGGSPAACAVGYRVTGEWSGGFQGEIVIRNTGASAVNGWTLRWTFPDSQRVSSLWGGTAAQSGAAVTVTAASYTATVPAAGSVTLGFTASRGSTNPAPTAFTLNGAACSTT